MVVAPQLVALQRVSVEGEEVSQRVQRGGRRQVHPPEGRLCVPCRDVGVCSVWVLVVLGGIVKRMSSPIWACYGTYIAALAE